MMGLLAARSENIVTDTVTRVLVLPLPTQKMGSRASIVMMLLPRTTCRQAGQRAGQTQDATHARARGQRGTLTASSSCRQWHTSKHSSILQQRSAHTHHHADVGLGLHVDRLVQHNVHELVEATQCARHVAVGVQHD